MDDLETLTALNLRFIDAFRKGSWGLLEPILSPGFAYLDGATGDVWSMGQYVAGLDGHPLPTINIDQVRVHIDGNAAVVSARTFTNAERSNRYVDSYERRNEGWLCVHACVWPLTLR